jgi:hypothetical protein
LAVRLPFTQQGPGATRALGEDLVGVLWRTSHDIEDSPDEPVGNTRMEQITHRVHKDKSGPSPPPGGLKLVRMEGQPEARSARVWIPIMLVLGLPHGLQASRERERVAVIATLRYAVASGNWVPGRLSPLDRALVAIAPPTRLLLLSLATFWNLANVPDS